jgi:hypothetical protein
MPVCSEVPPNDLVLRRAIRAYNERNEDGACQDAPEDFPQRITVNYTRIL